MGSMLLGMTVYRIEIDDEFCAAHSIRIRGEEEPVHGHNWQVRVVIESPELDEDGLVCDFHDVQDHLRSILDPFRNQSLNAVAPFDTVNPTAELVAHHIATRLQSHMRAPARVVSARVSEAPGCRAEVVLGAENQS